MIQLIYRFTCDQCGAVVESEPCRVYDSQSYAIPRPGLYSAGFWTFDNQNFCMKHHIKYHVLSEAGVVESTHG